MLNETTIKGEECHKLVNALFTNAKLDGCSASAYLTEMQNLSIIAGEFYKTNMTVMVVYSYLGTQEPFAAINIDISINGSIGVNTNFTVVGEDCDTEVHVRLHNTTEGIGDLNQKRADTFAKQVHDELGKAFTYDLYSNVFEKMPKMKHLEPTFQNSQLKIIDKYLIAQVDPNLDTMYSFISVFCDYDEYPYGGKYWFCAQQREYPTGIGQVGMSEKELYHLELTGGTDHSNKHEEHPARTTGDLKVDLFRNLIGSALAGDTWNT